MSSRNKGTIPETEAERALAEVARQRFADYQARWLPVQVEAANRLNRLAQRNRSSEDRPRRCLAGRLAGRSTRLIVQRNRLSGPEASIQALQDQS